MSLAGWLTALAVGLLAGGVAGLIGVGGGVVMVPFLYFFLSSASLSGATIPVDQQAVVAHATSLAAMIPITVRGAWLYGKTHLIDWRSVWLMGAASVAAALLGAAVAVAVPAQTLKAVFGIFLLTMGVRLALSAGRGADRRPIDGPVAHRYTRAAVGGAAVGFFSALLGVGGGVIAIPVLLYWLHLPIEKVSGTSLALIAITAMAGLLGYGLHGARATGELLGGLRYLHGGVVLALIAGALIAIPAGPLIQRRLSPRGLRWLFAVVFLILGARIVISNLLTANA